MFALLKAEWIQLKTTRTALWWAAIVLVLSIASPLVTLFVFGGSQIKVVPLDAVMRARGSDFILILFSVVAVSGNFRHRVSITERLIAPSIWPSLLSKLIAFGICGAAVIFLQSLIIGVLLLVWPEVKIEAQWSSAVWFALALLTGSFSAMLGVGWARLIRNQIAAVLVIIGYWVVFEPTCLATLQYVSPTTFEWLAPGFPGHAFQGLMGESNAARAISIAVISGWIVFLAGASYLLDRKRD